jgi:hypothetical protein
VISTTTDTPWRSAHQPERHATRRHGAPPTDAGGDEHRWITAEIDAIAVNSKAVDATTRWVARDTDNLVGERKITSPLGVCDERVIVDPSKHEGRPQHSPTLIFR